MTSEINLRCPGCGNGVFLVAGKGRCSRCAREAVAPFLPAAGEGPSCCAVCERRELYRQRDFNRRLGGAIATAACLVAFGLFFWNWFAALGVLVAAALLDLGLWLALSEIVVCYACGAIHRGFPVRPEVKPFSLMVAERHEKRAGGSGG